MKMAPEQLAEILRLHSLWLDGDDGGERAYLERANLKGANLGGAYLERADLKGANLGGAYLEGAYLGGADLRGAYLERAYLKGANLGGAYLEGAYLGGADLRGAYLERAYLERANLKGANLEGAYLERADLGGADLEGAYLERADLGGADLGGAYLGGAHLKGATLPDGVVWDVYVNTLVPALLVAGGRSLDDVARPDVWSCHSWSNCPMHAAFGVYRLADVPPLYRGNANLFVQLYDSRVSPLNDLAALRERWGLPALDAMPGEACER